MASRTMDRLTNKRVYSADIIRIVRILLTERCFIILLTACKTILNSKRLLKQSLRRKKLSTKEIRKRSSASAHLNKLQMLNNLRIAFLKIIYRAM